MLAIAICMYKMLQKWYSFFVLFELNLEKLIIICNYVNE